MNALESSQKLPQPGIDFPSSGKPPARIFDLDFIRVVACLLVVVFHASSDYVSTLDIHSSNWWISNAYNSFSCCGVPLFIMLSGAIMLDRSIDRLQIAKKLLKFALIYAIAAVIYAAYHLFWVQDFKLNSFAINLVNGEAEYHLWFLYLISTLYLLTPLLSGVRQLNNKQILGTIVTILLLHNACKYIDRYSGLDIKLLYLKDDMFPYIAYYVFGYLVYRRWLPSWSHKSYAWLLPALIWLISGLVIDLATGFSSLSNRKYIGEFFYDNPNILVGSVAVSLFICLSLLARKINIKLQPIFTTMSGSVLGIYIIHPIVLQQGDNYLMSFFDEYISADWLGLRIMIQASIGFVISFIIVTLLRKWRPIRNLI